MNLEPLIIQEVQQPRKSSCRKLYDGGPISMKDNIPNLRVECLQEMKEHVKADAAREKARIAKESEVKLKKIDNAIKEKSTTPKPTVAKPAASKPAAPKTNKAKPAAAKIKSKPKK